MKTSQFVSRYIRDTGRNKEKRTLIMEMLEKGQPFEEQTVGAVAMIDISGFTALTSTLLAQQGRRSSEEMTQAVSKFMSKRLLSLLSQIIDIISYHGGDVIKFLGDALLIVFEAKSASENDLRHTTRRALVCCTEVLIKGKTKSAQSPTKVAGSPTKKKACEVDEDLLDLHIGLSAGLFNHVIVGVAGKRCDYFVHGPPLGEIGGTLDNARPGELGIAKSAVEVLELPETVYSQIKIRKYETKGGSQTCEFRSLEMLQTLLSKLEPSRPDFEENMNRKMSGIEYSYETEAELGNEMINSDNFCFQFMNQSLAYKIKNLQNSKRSGDTLIQMNPTSAINYDEELNIRKYGPSSEYRRVTIMFMKFRFNYTKLKAQQLFSVMIKGLEQYDGVTQQFSVDDKGQSFFAVFGLPPWSHENNAVFAVKAAVTVADMLKSQGLTPFTIGLSTGDLLFSHMGSPIRSEAGLLGDVVNVAARLMIFNKADGFNIFCDYDTHECTSELYQHAEIGLNMLKGKLEPVSIWAIKNAKSGIDNMKLNHKEKRFFGYAEEKAKITSIFNKWVGDGQKSILIVEGASGMGKTSLLEGSLVVISKIIKDTKVGAKVCLIRGSEIERKNPLFPIKNLMRSVYQLYCQMSDVEKVAMTGRNAKFFHSSSPLAPQTALKVNMTQNQTDSVTDTVSPLALPAKVTAKSKRISKHMMNIAAASIDDSIDATKAFLSACGENPAKISFLHPIFDWIGETETAATSDTSLEAKKSTIINMIVNIMKAMTEEVKIAVICDDLQFMDSTTLEILATVIQVTTKALYFLFSRPFTIYRLTALINLKNLPSTSHIALNGLSMLDTQKLLVWKFRDINGTKIDKDLLRVIHLKSSGSPAFLDKLAESLLGALPRVIAVDEKGVVTTTVSDMDYQEILAINVESAVLVAFDQLDHQFQEFLRVASAFGVYFDLIDVSAVIDGIYPPNDLIFMTETMDTFSFLEKNPEGDPNSKTKQEVPENLKRYKYSFTHVLICNTIYGSQPFGYRQEIHRRIGKYLEEQLTAENRTAVLPSVAFHYSNTSDHEKMLNFFEMLGLESVDRFLFQDGIGALNKLIQMYESERDEKNLKPVRQAQWYSALAFAESGKKSIQNARKNALKALSLIEAAWPETDQQYAAMLKENTRKQNLLWFKTIGGRLSTGEPNLEKDRVMFRCLTVLHNLASIDPSLLQKDIELINLSYLNLSIAYGTLYRPEFVNGCLKSAEWHWLSNNRYLSHVYFQQGKKFNTKISDYEAFLSSTGSLYIYKGYFEKGLEDLNICATHAKNIGDLSTFHMNKVFISTTLITVGKLEESNTLAEENFRFVEENDEHIMILLYAVSLEVSAVLTDNLEAAAKYSGIIASKADYTASSLAKVFRGACAIYDLRKGNLSKALETFEEMITSGIAFMTIGQKVSMQLFGYYSIFPFLYYSQEKGADTEKIHSLLQTLSTAVTVGNKLWAKPCAEAAAACCLYSSAQHILQGEPELGIAPIIRALAEPRIKKMKLLYGFHLAIVARFSKHAAQQEKYAKKASEVLSSIGAKGLAEWAKGAEVGQLYSK